MEQNQSIKSILSRKIGGSKAGKIWSPADFVKLGSRDAVDKALQRLAREGMLQRLQRGLYHRPRINPLTGKAAAPDYRAVIEAIARRDQARMLVDGMTAANDLGLSDAVPGRVVVHSDARLKPVRVGNLTLSFRPTSARKLYWAGRPGMRIVQALFWLKPKLDDAEYAGRVRRRLVTLLTDSKHGPTLRRDLARGLPSLPAWMQEFLRPLLAMHTNKSSPSDRLRRRSPAP